MLHPIRPAISLTILVLCSISGVWAQAAQPATAMPPRPVLGVSSPQNMHQNLHLLADGQKGQVAQFIEYQDGKLRIIAEDSTLDRVLQAVSQVTGTRIELPSGLQPERIAVTLGPAPMADVIRALLDSSRFNYVILGSPSHPENISSVVIKLRDPSNNPVQAVSAVPTPAQPYFPAVPAAALTGQPLPGGATQQAILAQQQAYQNYVAAQQDPKLRDQLMQVQMLKQQQLMQQQQRNIEEQERAQEMGTPPPSAQ
jgi:hypothetical protein